MKKTISEFARLTRDTARETVYLYFHPLALFRRLIGSSKREKVSASVHVSFTSEPITPDRPAKPLIRSGGLETAVTAQGC